MSPRFLKFLGTLMLIGCFSVGANAQGGVDGLVKPLSSTPLPQVSPNQLIKFYQETQNLRQKIWQTQEELRLLYLQPAPNWDSIIEKRAELVKLRTELQKKAIEAGLPYYWGRGSMGGSGLGMKGMGMRGMGMKGMGICWLSGMY